jgi:UrcA family protein
VPPVFSKEQAMKKIVTTAFAVTACMAASVAFGQAMEEVVVEGSPIVRSSQMTLGNNQPWKYTVMMSSRVGYSDLDLSTPDGVATLEKRISAAATEVCDALGKAYPDTTPGTAKCAKNATEKAMASAQKAIAGAKKK